MSVEVTSSTTIGLTGASASTAASTPVRGQDLPEARFGGHSLETRDDLGVEPCAPARALTSAIAAAGPPRMEHVHDLGEQGDAA